MAWWEIALMIALLVFGVFLTVAVLLQHGKSYGLSGTISGGAETFFGKDKGGRIDKVLSRVTTVFGVIFVILVLVVFLMQPSAVDYITRFEGNIDQNFGDFLK